MKLVSIVIPFYRLKSYQLLNCLNSIGEQSYKNLEIILINDGNTDITEADIQRYVKRTNIKNLKYVYQDNRGVSAARNRGIEMSTGKYIAFVDADDIVESSFIHDMVRLIDEKTLPVCGVDGAWFPVVKGRLNINIFRSFPSRYAWVQYINFCANKLFNASIIKTNNLKFREDVKLGEDALFLQSYIKHIKYVSITESRLYHYIQNPNSAVNKFDKNYWDYEKEVINQQYQFFSEQKLERDESLFLNYWLYIKIKATLYYYLSNSSKDSNERVKEVVSDKLYDMLMVNFEKNNPYYNIFDKLILWFWRFGVKGIEFAYLIKRIRDRMKKYKLI